jgi:hypothetical protein
MSLAIESGATHSVALFMPDDNDQVKKFSFGPANFKLMKETQLEIFFAEIKKTSRKYNVKRLAVAMAGLKTENDKKVSVFVCLQRIMHLFNSNR